MLLILLSLYLTPLKPRSSVSKNKTQTWIEHLATNFFIHFFQVTKKIHTSLKSVTENFSSDKNLRQENKKLKHELALLKTQLQLTTEKYLQLQRITTLTSETLTTIGYHPVIPAEIMAFNFTPFSCTLLVNRGVKDGVSVNSAVAYGESLVGFVVTSLKDSAVVQLLVDPRTTVSGLILPARQLCLVKSRGPKRPLLLSVEKFTLNLEIGNEVITSGIDTSIYPKGLMIGKITSLTRTPQGELVGEVEPQIDFSKLEEVFIIPKIKSID